MSAIHPPTLHTLKRYLHLSLCFIIHSNQYIAEEDRHPLVGLWKALLDQLHQISQLECRGWFALFLGQSWASVH